jgi:hypothetical protein
MNVSKLITVLAFPLCVTGAAWAHEASGTDNPGAAASEAPLARAEVLADLQVWRESGMAAVSDGEEGRAYTPAHDAASARYAALRSAPSFAALVLRIAHRLGENVVLAAAR